MDAEAVVTKFVEAVREGRRTGGAEQWEKVAELLDDKVEWRFAGGDTGAPWWHHLVGRDAVVSALSVRGSGWSVMTPDTFNVLAGEHQVLLEQISHVSENIGEGEWRKPVAHVFTLKGDAIVEIRTYRNDRAVNYRD